MTIPIFLIGFMGVGKTTTGKIIADKLKKNFIDTDNYIEQQEGLTIPEIFKLKNESYFRKLETDCIRNLSKENSVISCGGGLPCFNDNLLFLKNEGWVIHLDADIQTIVYRISAMKQRPIWNQFSQEELFQLKNRRNLYYQQAHLFFNEKDDVYKIISNIQHQIN